LPVFHSALNTAAVIVEDDAEPEQAAYHRKTSTVMQVQERSGGHESELTRQQPLRWSHGAWA
jgi:hypothetical protein